MEIADYNGSILYYKFIPSPIVLKVQTECIAALRPAASSFKTKYPFSTNFLIISIAIAFGILVVLTNVLFLNTGWVKIKSRISIFHFEASNLVLLNTNKFDNKFWYQISLFTKNKKML